ncbi:MAG TPA: universal stress protein [Burkholderiaceae bacterium]|nr:universal stress protein [Burkholderiaceae bacterium]
MKILLPVDGSDYTKRMLAFVAAHDELFGAGNEFTVCTAVAPIPPNASRFLDRRTLEDYYAEQAEHVLAPVRKFAEQHGWKASFKHVHGFASECIAALANELKPDLIVMGSHGHSALGNVVLGSVANGVLARCKAPVLLVR